MPKTQVLRITVPDDAEEPLRLVLDAVERYADQTYPVWSGDMAREVRDDGGPVAYAIIIEED